MLNPEDERIYDLEVALITIGFDLDSWIGNKYIPQDIRDEMADLRSMIKSKKYAQIGYK
jgi:hypothetical protein